ncbi:MAG: hypothetical protein PHI91_02295 [Candidatus Pacebacteria bacterium]|nr:hypothetical protein [Candidatus Paceibacterota bacterium]MDD2757416.1 hypothetical protein [Candidatus Paceibacterota bacterium]MDD3283793.1 hypothetical protein [Candidatus Paceibacterota bacterium]MDD3969999.1 hypothetical protein [Candidatus Paceibacterota bacterium]MDD4738065.1 hypothetical protein [Candidatus Paceibacterota bacterium]
MNVQEKIVKECEECYRQMIESSINKNTEKAESFMRSKMGRCRFAPYGCIIAEKIIDHTNSFYSQPQS